MHVLETQGTEWRRRLRFRDILIANDSQRHRYVAAKRAATAVANGWGEHTRAKSSVVAEILEESDNGIG
ncbi:GrpB family protein [Microbacterium paludicola]|uniref:GrpB family protein n=1 Tax=Microbacterium paludicola TaxID=300019 RepID=UPI00119FABA7